MLFGSCESCGRRLPLVSGGMSTYCNQCRRDLVKRHSEQSMQRNYRGASPERVFAACLRVVASEGWQIRHPTPQR